MIFIHFISSKQCLHFLILWYHGNPSLSLLIQFPFRQIPWLSEPLYAEYCISCFVCLSLSVLQYCSCLFTFTTLQPPTILFSLTILLLFLLLLPSCYTPRILSFPSSFMCHFPPPLLFFLFLPSPLLQFPFISFSYLCPPLLSPTTPYTPLTILNSNSCFPSKFISIPDLQYTFKHVNELMKK